MSTIKMSEEKWICAEKQKPGTERPVLAVCGKAIIRAMCVPGMTVSTDDAPYEGDADYSEEKDTYYWPEGWYEWNRYEETHWTVDDAVTHWRPLPALPPLTEAKEG